MAIGANQAELVHFKRMNKRVATKKDSFLRQCKMVAPLLELRDRTKKIRHIRGTALWKWWGFIPISRLRSSFTPTPEGPEYFNKGMVKQLMKKTASSSFLKCHIYHRRRNMYFGGAAAKTTRLLHNKRLKRFVYGSQQSRYVSCLLFCVLWKDAFPLNKSKHSPSLGWAKAHHGFIWFNGEQWKGYYLPTRTISRFRSPGSLWYLTTSSYGAATALKQPPGHRA